MINEQRQRLWYVLADYVSTNLAVLLFNVIRYNILPVVVTNFYSLEQFLTSPMVMAGQILFPFGMLLVYYLSGYYNKVYVKSRVVELSTTLSTAFIGTLVVIFVALINDLTNDRAQDYRVFFAVFALLFFVVYVPRLIITWHVTKRLCRREIYYSTMIVGYGTQTSLFEHQIMAASPITGLKATLLVDADNGAKAGQQCYGMPMINIGEVAEQCEKYGIRKIVVIPHPDGWESTLPIINRLFPLQLPIMVAADSLPPYLFSTHLVSLTAEPFIDVSRTHASAATLNIKRAIDVTISLLALVVLAVPLAFLAIAVRIDSPGPAFYKQTRVGRLRKLFDIYKLRTMVYDAEPDGTPVLSQPGDKRITRIGRFLRKYRLDELPQFYNVLRGDMSLVGPRPERLHFVEQIAAAEPSYALIHSVRPGLTSLGMVKYGYASTVEQMLHRMRYDLIYLENMSLLTDMKILLYTAHTVLSGKGI